MILEATSKTQESFSSGIQTPQSELKNLGCASFFQATCQCLDVLLKNSVSLLIYYY